MLSLPLVHYDAVFMMQSPHIDLHFYHTNYVFLCPNTLAARVTNYFDYIDVPGLHNLKFYYIFLFVESLEGSRHS